jgi:hypothetical protein
VLAVKTEARHVTYQDGPSDFQLWKREEELQTTDPRFKAVEYSLIMLLTSS